MGVSFRSFLLGWREMSTHGPLVIAGLDESAGHVFRVRLCRRHRGHDDAALAGNVHGASGRVSRRRRRPKAASVLQLEGLVRSRTGTGSESYRMLNNPDAVRLPVSQAKAQIVSIDGQPVLIPWTSPFISITRTPARASFFQSILRT